MDPLWTLPVPWWDKILSRRVERARLEGTGDIAVLRRAATDDPGA